MKKIKRLITCIVVGALAMTGFVFTTGCNSTIPYDLSYVAWNLSTESANNIERRMIAEFERRHDVRVQIKEAGTGAAYLMALSGWAAMDVFPDVFLAPNLAFGMTHGYFANISELAYGDEDWANIPEVVRDAVNFRGTAWAVPFAMHMMGYFVNKTLLENQNIAALSVAPDFEDMIDAVRAVSSQEGLIGLNTEDHIFEWYAASVDPDLGWFAWNEEEEIFALNSPAFQQGLAATRSIREEAITFRALDEEQRDALGAFSDDVDFWNAGRMGLRWGQTFEIPDMLENSIDEFGNEKFEIGFLGVPGGRTPIVPDFLGISPTSRNPELAWEFAKWMSFSPEGISYRLHLVRTYGAAHNIFMNTMPMTMDEDVIDEFFDLWPVYGLREAYESLNKYGIVEGVKVVPGFMMARWDAPLPAALVSRANTDGVTTIGTLIDNVWNGRLDITDFPEIQRLASDRFEMAIEGFRPQYLGSPSQ